MDDIDLLSKEPEDAVALPLEEILPQNDKVITEVHLFKLMIIFYSYRKSFHRIYSSKTVKESLTLCWFIGPMLLIQKLKVGIIVNLYEILGFSFLLCKFMID